MARPVYWNGQEIGAAVSADDAYRVFTDWCVAHYQDHVARTATDDTLRLRCLDFAAKAMRHNLWSGIVKIGPDLLEGEKGLKKNQRGKALLQETHTAFGIWLPPKPYKVDPRFNWSVESFLTEEQALACVAYSKCIGERAIGGLAEGAQAYIGQRNEDGVHVWRP